MKVLLLLVAAFATSCFAYTPYRRYRDIGLKLREFQNSYHADASAYVPPISTNIVPGYDYPKPNPPVVQPPKVNNLYLPAPEPTSPPFDLGRHRPRYEIPFENNLLPLPSNNRPTYYGSGPYIWDYESEGTHKVEVQDPFHRYSVNFPHH